MATDEEMLKNLEKKFPKYAGNLKLAKALWNREQNTGVAVNGDDIEYVEKKISEVEDGENVIINGVIADIKLFNYQGCSNEECRKKVCDCGVDKKKYINRVMLVGDAEDVIDVAQLAMSDADIVKQRLNIGDEVKVKGWVKTFKNKKQISANEIEVETDEDEGFFILDKLVKHGSMSEDMFKRLCENSNVDYEKLKDKIVVDESGYVSVKK